MIKKVLCCFLVITDLGLASLGFMENASEKLFEVTGYASSESENRSTDAWIGILNTEDPLGSFIMAGTYKSPLYPDVIDVENQTFTKAVVFSGTDNQEYSGSQYTGRLYHEYLKDSDKYTDGDYITVTFYGRAESSTGSMTKIRAFMQAETDGHITGSGASRVVEASLSENWEKYELTIPVTAGISGSDAGYRLVLDLGYYGQTTYIADVHIYRSRSSEFDERYIIDDLKVMINDSEAVNMVSSGTVTFSAYAGEELTSLRLILALYNDVSGMLHSIEIAGRESNGQIVCNMTLPDVVFGYSLKTFVLDTKNLMPLNDMAVFYPDYNDYSDLAMTGGTIDNPLVCEIGKPAVISDLSAMPTVTFKSDYTAECVLNLKYPDGTVQEIANGDVSENKELSVNLNDAINGEIQSGEYMVLADSCIGEHLISEKDLYFYVQEGIGQVSAYAKDDGTLDLIPDYKGNRIPDYSSAGYKDGEPIPYINYNIIELSPSGGDDTDRIQEKIDYLEGLSPNQDGYRGVLLLKEGIWQISRTITINEGGIIIRGENYTEPNLDSAIPIGTVEEFKETKPTGTVLLATSKTPNDLLFSISGGSIYGLQSKAANITDLYVPVGINTVKVDNAQMFNVGDCIILEQQNNLDWIHAIGMDNIPSRTTPDANPGNPDSATYQWTDYDWIWKFERRITAINGNSITFDAPIVNSIDAKYSSAQIYPYMDTRISNIGIENIRVFALWSPNQDNVDDTCHAERFVEAQNTKNIWISNVTAEHFNTYCVHLRSETSNTTISNFYNLIADQTYYEGTGYEETGRTFLDTQIYVGRYGVYIAGQKVLMSNVNGINNRHLIEYSSKAAGPNVAYKCISKDYLTSTGPHMMWSVGGLYDNVTAFIAFQNRLNMGSGHGWAGAWYTAWNTDGVLVVQQPPEAQNYSVGHVGEFRDGDFKEYDQGSVTNAGTHFSIESLYQYQLMH